MSYLEKWTDGHERMVMSYVHINIMQQDKDVCYNYIPWSNMYIEAHITWKESDRKLSAQSTYAEVCIVHEQVIFSHGTAIL